MLEEIIKHKRVEVEAKKEKVSLADLKSKLADAPGVRAIAASHRIGSLQIGDAALVVAVAADHRAAAFETCARLVK